MSIKQFLTSKTFLIQIGIAFVIIIASAFLFMNFLSFRTNHGDEIPVPDLSKMQFNSAEEKLDEIGLEIVMLDTVDFKEGIPPYAIVEQDPIQGSMVKDGRKIYVKLNSGEYNDISLPDFKEKTYRQIIANFKSIGLKEGKTTYQPHIAKDVVLQVMQNGKKLKKGDKIKKNSTVDFVLGDGKELFNNSDLINSTEEGSFDVIEIKEGE